MDISRTGDVWWKNAVIYCLDVETFQDSNGDGIGDFAGLTRRIDHLAGLGVTCIWLMLNLSLLTWERFLIWMALGVVIYFAYGRRHARLGQTAKDDAR